MEVLRIEGSFLVVVYWECSKRRLIQFCIYVVQTTSWMPIFWGLGLQVGSNLGGKGL